MILKHLGDRLVAAVLLLLLLPVFAVIALLIKLDTRGPVLFTQDRVGKDESVFRICKFRSMIVNAITMGHGVSVLENDFRVTRVGKHLRNWSLDELPQLINILKGEMSFVGPRPTLQYQVDQYTPFQRKRLKMRPGVTGLAQINGRKGIPWEKRIEYDVDYVENWSLWLDLKIILRTVGVTLWRRKGLHCGDNVKEFDQE